MTDTLLVLARDFVSGARQLPKRSDRRIAALLTRQALETIIAERVRKRLGCEPPGQMRAALACLVGLGDEHADDADYAWQVLSHMCHQHQFELSPGAAEVSRLIEKVDELAAHWA